MHAVAEHGVASHWLYKKGMSKDLVDIDSLAIINQLKELRKDHLNDGEFFNEIKSELLGDSIFVFTPKGEVKKLPIGSTAIDFAYAIHSRIGETLVGAKADGHIIPLSKPLKNTQIIEILTNPQAHPTENQLRMVKTARARSKIRAWLSLNNPSEAPAKEAPKSAAKPLTEPEPKLEPAAAKIGADAAVKLPAKGGFPGAGEVPLQDTEGGVPVKIRIGDTANFLASTAKCCRPKYGEPIVGYVSRGRGIIVHRADCKNFSRIANVAERTVQVMWKDISIPNAAKS